MRRPDKERLKFLEETSRGYEVALTESPHVLSYLHGRGVSTASTDRFRLGLVADPPADHKSVEGRLAIPIIKQIGITAFKFKCIRPECMVDTTVRPWKEKHEGHAKYISYEPMALYNVAALDNDKGFIALAEGEFDAIVLDGECEIPAVGLPGTSSWGSHRFWRRLLRDFKRVYVFKDQDVHLKKSPGQKLADQILADVPHAIEIDLPVANEGEKTDVTEIYCGEGRGYLREQVGLAA